MDREQKFLFKILTHQIRNVAKWFPPESNQYEKAAQCFWDSITEDGVMHINKVKFPDIRGYGAHANPSSWYGWPTLYAECIMIHHLFDDDYNLENFKIIEDLTTTGPYCLENVAVEKGDVVIDAGAYIGDWSAVAAQMGGRVYAFEPSPTFSNILDECAKLNDFEAVHLALGDVVCQKKLITDTYPFTEKIDDNKGIPCSITTIDEFAKQNNLHIDFIKSDIEGYERNMLYGAKETLRRDEPKLSLCTYHNNKEDAIILPKIIMSINPRYNITFRNMKLFAWVNK